MNNNSTTLNGNIVKMRECKKISDAFLLASDHLCVHKYQKGDNFENLIKIVKLYRTWGDCYGYSLLASGYADIMIDPIMSVWDIQALVPIIKGAGGIITDYQGNEVTINSQSIIASSDKIHKKIIDILNK